jgi:glycosyltransferase involved in cell wall biosynthesis
MNRPVTKTNQPAANGQPEPGLRVLVISNDRDYFLHHRLPIVERLVARGCSVTVAAGGRPETPDQARDWRFVPLPFDRLSINPVGNLWFLLRCLRLIGRVRPNVLHLLTLKPAMFGGLAAMTQRLAGRGPERLLITIPGLGRLMSPGGDGAGRFSSPARSLVGSVMRFLSGRKGVFFSFETAQDRDLWLQAGYVRPGNSTVINGAGVDPARFQPADQAATRTRMRVLFASRFLRSKGLDAFIDVARRLADRDDVEFAVAGMPSPGDPDSMTPEELARESSITFLGEITDMPTLLATTDLVCLPTRYGEGVPRILIEAAACGLPVLATDIAGCKEIAEDGVTGFLVPANDPEGMPDALESAIGTYLDNRGLLRTHGLAGRERFLRRGFDSDSVVDGFEALLLGNRPEAATGR